MEASRDGFWLYVVTNCGAEPILQEPIQDPAQHPWNEVTKVQHYYRNVDAMTQPMEVREETPPYGSQGLLRGEGHS